MLFSAYHSLLALQVSLIFTRLPIRHHHPVSTMAKHKGDEDAKESQPKKAHKRKWSHEDHGGDLEFIDKAFTPKKRSASTTDILNLDSTPVKLHDQTPNTPNTDTITPKRRGRKPGTKMLPKAKEYLGCQCFTPHESSYRCQLEAKFSESCNISAK